MQQQYIVDPTNLSFRCPFLYVYVIDVMKCLIPLHKTMQCFIKLICA
jgi:hypothetical protein